MDRPRLIRGLRIAVSAVFGMLCVLLIFLWVRSYSWTDDLWVRVPNSGMATEFVSLGGQVGVVITPSAKRSPWIRETKPVPDNLRSMWNVLLPRRNVLGFMFAWKANTIGIGLPNWFVILTGGTLATAPWIHWGKRFSLRTLLIATTLIAALLGTAAYLRLW